MAIGVLLLLGSLLQLALRIASIAFGVHLLRSGSKIIAANPASAEDTALVDEVKEKVTALIAGPPRFRSPSSESMMGSR